MADKVVHEIAYALAKDVAFAALNESPEMPEAKAVAQIATALRKAAHDERERIIALFGPGGPHFGPFGKKLARIIRESAHE